MVNEYKSLAICLHQNLIVHFLLVYEFPYSLLWVAMCSIPCLTHPWKLSALVPQNIAMFGNKVFKDVIVIRQGDIGGLYSNTVVLRGREAWAGETVLSVECLFSRNKAPGPSIALCRSGMVMQA